MRFILDPSRILKEAQDSARGVAEALIAQGLRKTLACPAPSAMDRRIPLWRAFQRMKNLGNPFDAPLIRNDDPLERRPSLDGVYQIVKNRLEAAEFPKGFATPHGLRSGFLTQAALEGAPIQAAMRLSLHRSLVQAQKYYVDVDIVDNPATELLG